MKNLTFARNTLATMPQLQKLPIGLQNFEKIRTEGYLYVDKTQHIAELLGGVYYFISRPRRFGKSLLLSTLHAYFEGKKELFNGLKISQLEKEWKQYPILHLDLNVGKYENKEALLKRLDKHLVEWENQYSVKTIAGDTLGNRFETVIKTACQQAGLQAVVLIDEYEKPILDVITNEALADDYRATLRGFYSALKSSDQFLKFVFITGVTKLGKMSIFSGLNNLRDISFSEQYADLCGISEDELKTHFEPYVQQIAQKYKMSLPETYAKLKEMYDGYHFCENAPGMYNPFSLLNCLSDLKFENYWFSTGTPTFLVELIKKQKLKLIDIAHREASAELLGSFELLNHDPIPAIYQTGYLTIKGYNQRFEKYRLGFPNREVEKSFLEFVLPYFHTFRRSNEFEVSEFIGDVEAGNAEGFIRRLRSFLAAIPYEIQPDTEVYFQNTMFVLFRLMGYYARAEERTSEGRMDLLVETDRYLYVMELKLNQSAAEALQQIDSKDYALPYQVGPKKLFKIGINFNTQKRNVDDWKVESD